jgi:COMPASS component BRE2
VEMGSPFEGLFAFLPPASRATNSNNVGIGKRENADDGMIGYFPAVSCHNGGAVECRFEAPWWYGPPKSSNARPFGDRYNDQIVEDVVADIVDEVEAAFKGWNTEAVSGVGAGARTGIGARAATNAATLGNAGMGYFCGDGAGGGYASASAAPATGTADFGFDDNLSRSSTHTPHYQPATGSLAGSTLDSATFASEKDIEDVEMT